MKHAGGREPPGSGCARPALRARSLAPVIAPILAAACGCASAQSVVLYGRVDLGLQYSTKTGSTDDSLSEVYNGGILPSIWGFRGTEDLGGGLSAFFNLEAHLFADTGVSARAGQSFRRQSNVGLKGSWGTLTLGRQYSPALLAHLATEPRGFKEQFSGLYPYALNQNGDNPTNDIGVFVGNAVAYGNDFGPVKLGASYSFGEVAGSTSKGQALALGLTYTGPVIVSASYQRINDVGSGSDGTRHYGLGAALPLGDFTLKTLYMNARQETGGVRVAKVDTISLGADYVWGVNKATVAFYRNKDKENPGDETKTLVLSNDHALSKRTTVYAQLAWADADDGATARTSVIAGGSFPGEKTTAFGVGIKHDF